ncbi:AraC family transcriptional regulator [Klebsiella pneumoniae]|nr:AraC family transcriptional regulator [Klebsiella pneumoniae]
MWSRLARRRRPVPEALCAALASAHARGCRIISICSGVFVLAAAGLLNGRQATTHWRYTAALQSRFPQIQVVEDVLYVGDALLMTSAGSAAGIDLCLHLVREDFGSEAANVVARRLVVSPHRDGGQAQQVLRPVARSRESLRSVSCLTICTSILPPAIPSLPSPARRHGDAHLFAPL